MKDEIRAFPNEKPSVIETAEGLFLVDADGNVIEELAGPDDCMQCGDDCCVDPTTQLCDACFEHTFGDDYDECQTCYTVIVGGETHCMNCAED